MFLDDLKGIRGDHRDRSNWTRQKRIHFRLWQALRKLMFVRRNENESSQILFQLMACIQQISLSLQEALEADLEKLPLNGYIIELKKYI